MTVTVVTDASAAIAPARLAEHGVFVLPLHVLCSSGEYIDDGAGPATGWFVTEGVTTSGPSAGEVREVLERAVRASDGDGVVVIAMSSHLSSTYSTAVGVAAALAADITVIDSKSIDMAMGFGVLAAARAAAAGADRDEVAEVAHRVLGGSEAFFCVATLDHLRAGGRVGAVTALLGGALQIAPVLRLSDGRIHSVRKTRTVARAREQVAQLAAEFAGTDRVRVAVHHVGDQPAADRVAAMVAAAGVDTEELVVGPFGGTISAHLGPGAVGVVIAPA